MPFTQRIDHNYAQEILTHYWGLSEDEPSRFSARELAERLAHPEKETLRTLQYLRQCGYISSSSRSRSELIFWRLSDKAVQKDLRVIGDVTAHPTPESKGLKVYRNVPIDADVRGDLDKWRVG